MPGLAEVVVLLRTWQGGGAELLVDDCRNRCSDEEMLDMIPDESGALKSAGYQCGVIDAKCKNSEVKEL